MPLNEVEVVEQAVPANSAPKNYWLPSSKSPEEIKRLDKHSEKFREFYGGGLSSAPLEKIQPKRILELGSGSGYWAAQAADTYPDAEVIAVDITPLAPQHVRKNLKYLFHNLLEPLPFEPSSFDIIHERLVFMHLPNAEDILTRAASLLKPGGFLLLEDVTFLFHERNGELGPGMKIYLANIRRDITRRGLAVDGSASYERILKDSGTFDEVHLFEYPASCQRKEQDPRLKLLEHAVLDSFEEGPLLNYPGATPELTKKIKEEWADQEKDTRKHFYTIWARKAD